MELECIEFELRDVVENASQRLAIAAHKKGLEVICDIDSNLPKRVVGDPNRLRQVLTNLIGIAIKFIDAGEIQISLRCVEDQVVFAVSETGIGTPAEKQALIFEAFRQSDNSTTRQFGGIGLGLSICQDLVELMGGTLQLDSNKNNGSCFHFALQFDQLLGSQREFATDDLRGFVVALLCESPRAARSYASMLECIGLSVMTFDSVPELSEEDVHDFDCVVIDDQLLDSWNQQNRSTEHIVVLTKKMSIDDDGILRIKKPLALKDLKRTLNSLLHHVPASVPLESADIGAKQVCRILLADDSAVNREVVTGLLEHAGHIVEVAENGQEAIDKFGAGNFDLILMDLEMPEVDGLGATKAIRQHLRGATIPIVAMSAHDRCDKELECREAGFDDYLAKPFDPRVLLLLIDKMAKQPVKSLTATV